MLSHCSSKHKHENKPNNLLRHVIPPTAWALTFDVSLMFYLIPTTAILNFSLFLESVFACPCVYTCCQDILTLFFTWSTATWHLNPSLMSIPLQYCPQFPKQTSWCLCLVFSPNPCSDLWWGALSHWSLIISLFEGALKMGAPCKERYVVLFSIVLSVFLQFPVGEWLEHSVYLTKVL